MAKRRAVQQCSGLSHRHPTPTAIDHRRQRQVVDGQRPGGPAPLMQLPGLAYSYEMQVGGQPAFAYFAAVASGEKTATAVSRKSRRRSTRRSRRPCGTMPRSRHRTAAPITMKLLSVTGSQKFGQDCGGRSFRSVPGEFGHASRPDRLACSGGVRHQCGFLRQRRASHGQREGQPMGRPCPGRTNSNTCTGFVLLDRFLVTCHNDVEYVSRAAEFFREVALCLG